MIVRTSTSPLLRAAVWSALFLLPALGCANTEKSGTTVVGDSAALPSSEAPVVASGTTPVRPATEPQHIQVQHILIGFSGSVPNKSIARSQAEAKALAYQILDRARAGEDFDGLVRQYTDDSPPGIYSMSAIGVTPSAGEFPRDQMVPAFGNVGFAISPGNIGIADYDATASPYGWHIIKRLK
jgi:hypothetical protein